MFENPIIYNEGDWVEYDNANAHTKSNFIRLMENLYKKDEIDKIFYVRSFNENGQITHPILYSYDITNLYKKTSPSMQIQLESAYQKKIIQIEKQKIQGAKENKEKALTNFLKINEVEMPEQPSGATK